MYVSLSHKLWEDSFQDFWGGGSLHWWIFWYRNIKENTLYILVIVGNCNFTENCSFFPSIYFPALDCEQGSLPKIGRPREILSTSKSAIYVSHMLFIFSNLHSMSQYMQLLIFSKISSEPMTSHFHTMYYKLISLFVIITFSFHALNQVPSNTFYLLYTRDVHIFESQG